MQPDVLSVLSEVFFKLHNVSSQCSPVSNMTLDFVLLSVSLPFSRSERDQTIPLTTAVVVIVVR